MFRPRIKANVRCKACSPVAKKGDGKPTHLREPTLKALLEADDLETVWTQYCDYEAFW